MPTKLALPLLFVLQDESDATVQELIQAPPAEYGLGRTVESVETERHDYVYASGELPREVITTTDAEGNATTEILDFTCDASGSPYTLTCNGTTYYYVVNAQGDVIRLVSANGASVAEYTYDPYGRVISVTGTMAEVNPLRYRGYYYDAETEFYYLQSRYYDPVVCRFINADGYASTGQEFLGKNMFAYCCNCPIILIDLSGTSASKVTILYDSNWFYGSQPSFCWLVAQQLYRILTSCLVYSAELVPFDSTSDFIEEWNNLEECDVLIIVMHGGVDCLGYNPCVGSDNTYSYDELNDIAVNDAVILTSCNGGTRDEHGRSAAQAVANKAGCPVRAVTDGEVYASPFSGAIFPTGDGFWETFYPESKRRVIPKDSLSLPQ